MTESQLQKHPANNLISSKYLHLICCGCLVDKRREPVDTCTEKCLGNGKGKKYECSKLAT